MPSSRLDNLPWVAEQLVDIRPKRTIDVGCGVGLYGMLVRNSGGDVYPDFPQTGTFHNRVVDAVEVWAAYLQAWHWAVYDTVYVGDICELAADLPAYDVVLCVDVLEHIDKARCLGMLRTMLDRSTHLVAVLPPDDIRHNSYAGNPYERHVSTWTEDDFTKLAGEVDAADCTTRRQHDKLCVRIDR